MVDDQRRTFIREVICQRGVIVSELMCVPPRCTAALHRFGIGAERLRPWNFVLDIISIRAHQLYLRVHRESHGDGSLEGTRNHGSHHTIERTEVLPHQARQSDA